VQGESSKAKRLQSKIDEDLAVLFPNSLASETPIKLSFAIDADLKEDQYELKVSDQIAIRGNSYQAITYGIHSILQATKSNGHLPKMQISDFPKYSYRAVMIDCSRSWHSIETLQHIIRLAAYYKLKYVQLHLTDDQLFTFQSKHYPLLASKPHSYTQEQLRELNEYAYTHGIILIPEIDIPGHASPFVKRMPEVFGIEDVSKNPYTISMAKTETKEALNLIFSELAEIFTYSPYIHIGGDEAHFAGFEEDPETIQYMKEKGILSVDELFRDFLIEMNILVKGQGKQMMVWAGFAPKGKLEIPRDITVVAWDAVYYHPEDLVTDGFKFVNASWKPLYVVNARKWSPQYIYETWNPRRWEAYNNMDVPFSGIEIDESDQLMGAMMCSWEQSGMVVMDRLRPRLAAMSAGLWQSEKQPYNSWTNTYSTANQQFAHLTQPFEMKIKGLSPFQNPEGFHHEHLRFADSLNISFIPHHEDITIQYTLNDSLGESPLHATSPITLTESSHITAQAFHNGIKIGMPWHKSYTLHPLSATMQGLESDTLAFDWDKKRFIDSATINISTPRDGTIDLTVRNENYEIIPNQTLPLTFTETTHIKAQLLDPKGNKIGAPLHETLYELRIDSCLTTGKPIIASTDKLSPNSGVKANNGRVSLWEHWGDLKKEENWLMVDLQEVEEITRVAIHFFWDNYRSYTYRIEASIDGQTWTEIVDGTSNTELSTIDGHMHEIKKSPARYVKLHILNNTANPGLHVTEFCVW